MAAPLLGVGLLARGTMRLAPKLVKRLRQEYIDDICLLYTSPSPRD